MSRATSFPPGTPAWIDLMTSDPEGARRFYAAVFGWDLDVGPEEFAFYTMAKVEGDVVAGLGGTPAPAEVPTSWTTYILTEDADDTAKTSSRVAAPSCWGQTPSVRRAVS